MKRYLLIILIMSLALAACQGNSPAGTLESAPPTGAVSESAAPSQAVPTTPAPASTQPQAASSTASPAGCTVVSPQPTPGPTEQSLFPAVGEQDWVKGPENAAVTIVEYSDFQCPFCAQLAPILDEIQANYPEDVRVIFRHLPLIGTPEEPFHDKAALAGQAAEAAGMQADFWAMHDLLFERQEEWADMSVDQFQEWLIERAAELGLDEEPFAADLVSEANAARLQAAWDHGVSINLLSTPFLLVNGRIWPSDLPLSKGSITAIVDLELLEGRQFSSCPPMSVDPSRQYTATLHTDKGDIQIELFADKAPIAVNNFIFLARSGWFDGVTFHRVLSGYIAQTGDPSGTGFGGPGYAFVNETSPDLKFDRAGLVAMANAGEDTNGSQFFITFTPAPDLDGGYTIFGEVISGMDVAESLSPRDPAQSFNLPPGDKILSVEIEEG